MFEETYQISRELTEQLLHEMYHPNADEIKRNNEALEKVRQTMHITRDGNGATVEFDDLDFEAIEKANQEKLEQANREAEELQNAKGNNDCTSGGCTI